MWLFVRALFLAHGVASAGYASPEVSRQQAVAAMLAEEKEISAELLLAIARGESHYRGDAGPGGKWRHWPKSAELFPRRKHYVCGVVQATTYSPRACLKLFDPYRGYRAGVAQLSEWARHCRRKGTPGELCTLRGYGGWSKGYRHPRLVLRRKQLILNPQKGATKDA